MKQVDKSKHKFHFTKVCYFGIYDSGYSRNRVIINGLRKNGIEVIECNSKERGMLKYLDLIKKYWQIRKKYDVMIVGFPGQQVMILARFLTKKPIIFDAFISLYDSLVYDRQLVKPKSLKAGYYWLLDWLSCHLADKILLDTKAHIDYFVKTFRMGRDKFARIFVGSDDEVIFPLQKKSPHNYFLVHFHGEFIPLQGIEYIIRSAKLLEEENIMFNIMGSGQVYNRIVKLAQDLRISNVRFINPVPYEELKFYMSDADVCLGIFGKTRKARRVIPNKVYEALACAKPVITGESPAAKELLVDRKNVLFCKMADERDLAKKILELKNNPDLRNKIAKNGYKLFRKQLTPAILVEGLLNLI